MLIYLGKNYLFLLLRTSKMTGNGNDGKAFDNFPNFKLDCFHFCLRAYNELIKFPCAIVLEG